MKPWKFQRVGTGYPPKYRVVSRYDGKEVGVIEGIPGYNSTSDAMVAWKAVEGALSKHHPADRYDTTRNDLARKMLKEGGQSGLGMQ